MECPYCGAELNYNDWYYRGNYSAGAYEKLGDIYKCPNYQGFDDIEEAKSYVENNNLKIGEGKDFESLEEVCCTSSEWNGNFYTDQQDNLHEGYPC
jgi:viroplasmin and RNaseH domain-containing protein